MDSIDTSARLMGNFDSELNQQFANEKSRTVKLCMLKYKCVLMFTFMLVAFLQFGYIMFKEFINDEQFKNKLFELIDFVSENSTVSHKNK